MSQTASAPSISPPNPASMTVMEAIARRVSCRAYKPEAVPETALTRILEAARLAPSACNQQPWRFAVVRDAAARRRIVTEGFLLGLKMTWALEAPVHVVMGMERSWMTHRLAASVSGVDYPWLDLGIAGGTPGAGGDGTWVGHLLDRLDQPPQGGRDRRLAAPGDAGGGHHGGLPARQWGSRSARTPPEAAL